MTITAIDATGLSPAQITALAKAGVNTVGRYLAHSAWKALNVGEVANLKAAGIQIFSIYESNPTKASYFSAAKGKSDALDAIALAKAVGQPEGTAIYFTVDYDARAQELPVILAYFKAIQANLTGYKVGAYGSYTVLNYLYQNNAADYWFQTIAWSSGQHCKFLNIYQFQIDKTLAGVNVDYNNLEKDDIGAWGQVEPKKESITAPAAAKPIMVVKVLNKSDVRSKPDHTSGYIGDVKPGAVYNVWKRSGDWHYVIFDQLKNVCGWVDGNKGKNLYWLDNPALKKK